MNDIYHSQTHTDHILSLFGDVTLERIGEAQYYIAVTNRIDLIDVEL
jgi:hypothetical protein